MTVHRKRIKHYHAPGDLHEFTFSCYRRWPLLTNDSWRRILSKHITDSLAKHRFQLVAFVYMLRSFGRGVEWPNASKSRSLRSSSLVGRPLVVAMLAAVAKW